MPTYNVTFYDADPFFILSQTVGGTATWTGPGTAAGTGTITDNNTGAGGLTLDNTGESATADLTLGATSVTGVTVSALESWTLRDTVTGQEFQVITFFLPGGELGGNYYTLAEVPLVNGRVYETLDFSNSADEDAGDPVFSYQDYAENFEHFVSGTAGADNIDSAYTGDPQGDQVDDGLAGGTGGNDNQIDGKEGDDTINAGLGDDTVYGGADNDVISGGAGNDDLRGGTGNDSIQGDADNDTLLGEAGNDTLEGGTGDDSLVGGAGTDTLEGGADNDTLIGDGQIASVEVLDWSAEGADGTNVAAGFTQNTGDIDVSVSFTDNGNNNPTFTIETSDTIYVEAGEDYDQNSSLFLFGDGDAATSTTTIDFAAATGAAVEDEVQNVNFRISDIDFAAGNHQDVVTVNAYDADGNLIPVTITPAGNDTVSGNTITAGLTGESSADAAGSVLVEIAGPVAQIEIIYENALTGTQGINVSDVFFETIPNATESSDSLDGGAGDDSILGGEGDDTLVGGAGSDTLDGGLGDDRFVLADGFGTDTIIGGEGVETAGDTVDMSALTDAATVTATGGDTGSFSAGSSSAIFDTIERLVLTGQGDTLNLTGATSDYEVEAGDGDDTLTGGGGADSILGQGGDDTFILQDGFGSDTLVGGETGETGGDALDLSNLTNGVTVTATGSEAGTVTDGSSTATYFEIENLILTDQNDLADMTSASGNDTLDGGLGADTLLAGGGADVLLGGQGADSIEGGTGSDTITGGVGNDTVTGGADDDVFVLADGFGNDTITDFDTGDTNGDGAFNDQLDVTGLTDAGGDPVNADDVTITDDGFGNTILTFPNGESIFLTGVAAPTSQPKQWLNSAGIPCFTEGTLIDTRKGEVPIASLRVGDEVLTYDNGPQKIRWIGKRELLKADLDENPDQRPIFIPEGACGNHMPLCVSPLHGMLVVDPATGAERLVRAKHLAEAPGPVRVAQGKKRVTYFHILLDSHQVIYANGAASESFYPGENGLVMLDADGLAEVNAAVPGLGRAPVEQVYGPTARHFMKRKDVLARIVTPLAGRAQQWLAAAE